MITPQEQHHATAPTNAQTGLQYTALPSLTSTDSMLRYLPSLKIAFPEFRLVQPQDPAVRAILSQQGLSRHAANFETQYLMTLVANANVENIRFPSPSQIAISMEEIVPPAGLSLSRLSETILQHCSPNTALPSGPSYQLPTINPYDTLIDLKKSYMAAASTTPTESPPAGSSSMQAISVPLVLTQATLPSPSVHSPSGSKESTPVSSSQKRTASGDTDDEDMRQHIPKKLKSRRPSVLTSNAKKPSPATPEPNSTDLTTETTPPTPIPATAIGTRHLSQEDPMTLFEDAVAEMLEALDEGDEGECPRLLSPFDIRQVAQSINDFSKKDLLKDIQIDTMASLLKYLDTATSHFDAVFTFPLEDRGADGTEDGHILILHRGFDKTILSLDHINLSLEILSSQGLLQHLFPEELLINSLNVLKSFVEKFMAPSLEYSKEDTNQAKGRQSFKIISTDPTLRQRMVALVSSTCEISEKLRKSCSTELSDGIIVKLVYIALSLFFIDSSSEMMVGLTEAESLKQAGSVLLRTLYSKYHNQRMWILEEILSSLIKLPHGRRVSKGYRLRDGSKIHASSALLLQLIHTCAERPVVDPVSPDFQELQRPAQKIEMQKFLHGAKASQDNAKTSVGYIFNFLLSRSTKGTKSSVDADYRNVLESLLHDLLTVLGLPEWPSAEICLLMLSKSMVKHLDDSKADLSSRQLAVDSLGLIAAKIKTISHTLSTQAAEARKADPTDEARPFYGEVNVETKLPDLTYLQANYGRILEFLAANEINDLALKAAKNTWICQWGVTICVAAASDAEDAWGSEGWNLLVSETNKCWKSLISQEPPSRTKTAVTRTDVLSSSAYLTSRLQLFLSFDMLLSRILLTLECSLVVLRTKSLRALSLIVTGDYEVLAQQNVRKTISLRLQDTSPAVRDAAIDLVGKYMLQDMKILRAYYEIVSDRISDTGLNVRKRVIRLLREIYSKAESTSVIHDISRKLLLRVNDDETTVRELAIKSVHDIWFNQFIQATLAPQVLREEYAEEGSTSVAAVTTSQKREVLMRARNLVDMVGQLSTSQGEAFGSVIQHLLRKEQGHNTFDIMAPDQEFTRGCSVIVGCLVDLIDVLQEEDAPKSAIIWTVHTLFTFIKAEPRLTAPKHLSALEAYLHSCTTNDDWKVTMFVLRIYEAAIPVVQGVPENFSQTVERLKGKPIQEKKTVRLMMLCGLLVKHYPFEQQINDSPTVAHLAELKAKMDPTVQDVVFKTLSAFCDDEFPLSLRQAATQCLGYVFMSFPALMDSTRSKDIMNAIFAGQDNQLKAELIHVYNNFLVKIQTTPSTDKGTGYSLVAKAEDHMDAGIGNAIMQQYLERVLQCALEADPKLQMCTVDVIAQVTAQALAHPGLCMPVVVALETSPDEVLRERTLLIHKDLHRKHASLIYAKSMECVRTMYMYQMSLQKPGQEAQGKWRRCFKEVLNGNVVSLLGPMYGLISDKRQTRNAFLSSMVKVLDVDLTVSNIEVDGDYCRFIAENLAHLEFKTMEEILLVIFYLNRIISGAGMTLMENLLGSSQEQLAALKKTKKKKTKATTSSRKSSRKKLAKSYAESDDDEIPSVEAMEDDGRKDEKEQDDDKEHDLPLHVVAKASVALEAAMVLKGHLKRVYDISETKCQQFQPTASASHKEKPSAKFTGLMARIPWMWGPGDVAKLCDSPGRVSEALVKKQLFRFKQMIETEMIHKAKDEEASHGKGSYSSHSVPSHSKQLTHFTHSIHSTRQEMHVDDEENDEDDDEDVDEDDEDEE
ncbi:Sister chromatid cohesion protein 2 [Podila horticola]|nr:Sister chromatid cohesion protein 2 [Podila horticola]